MWLLYTLTACVAFASASLSRKPSRLEQLPIGISLGADYISAAIATDKHETRFILQIEGDSLYKSYMRQDLWERPYRRPRAIESAQIKHQLTTILQSTHGRPPSVKKLRPIIEDLKKKLAKALGQNSFLNIVIGVPLFLSVQTRNDIHTEMHEAGFQVLSTIRQPALASTLFSFGHAEMPNDTFTTLVVDYNRASLDLSITPSAYGASDMLAQKSHPELGEEALDLKIAGLVLNETIEAVPLGTLAQQIHVQRHRSRESVTSGKEVEREHYKAVLDTIDDFVNQHSYSADYTMSSAWNPRLSETSNMLLTGDADEFGFEFLRSVLDQSDVEWPLDSEKNSSNPRQVSARGAAIHAKARVKGHTDQQLRLMVPHDL